jgi:nudix-type nucleoside diphosphatase (YffH/AdpP family)
MSAEIIEIKTVYQGWAKYLIADIRLADGQRIKREIEHHGDAIAVLPYDPERKVAILVRQLRAPVLLAAKAPDLLESIAGMIDDDGPEETVRRESLEEAGLRLAAVEHVGRMWTTPGVSTERMDLYLAAYSSADRVGDGGGLAEDHENITVVEMSLAELARAADAGTLADMKLFALVQTLRLKRPELFAT